MHADGKSTLASVSKWNSGKVNLEFRRACFMHFSCKTVQEKKRDERYS